MATIVLLGFSTAGKSHYKGQLEKEYPHIDTADSDKYVAKEFGNIYKIFTELNRDKALRYIETKENEFLLNIPESKNILIAAGPALVARANFNRFHQTHNPEYFYLKREPENIYNDLIKRHYEQLKIEELASNESFGCWDLDVTKEFRNKKYILIEKDLAISNITRHLSQLERFYSTLAQKNVIDADKLRSDQNYSKSFYQILVEKLTN